MRFVKLASSLITMLVLSSANLALAADDHKGHNHDDKKGAEHSDEVKPRHGGVVAVVKDIHYELVATPNIITLYVTDHGKPVDTKDASATLTLLSPSYKADVKLVAGGENKLQAKGDFKVQPGTKVAGVVKMDSKPGQAVRFTLK